MAQSPDGPIGRTAADLETIAQRCEERRASGFIVNGPTVDLIAEALRALARERARR